mgnify:CR=1 FL=1
MPAARWERLAGTAGLRGCERVAGVARPTEAALVDFALDARREDVRVRARFLQGRDTKLTETHLGFQTDETR